MTIETRHMTQYKYVKCVLFSWYLGGNCGVRAQVFCPGVDVCGGRDFVRWDFAVISKQSPAGPPVLGVC
jgi:hypothetical protein